MNPRETEVPVDEAVAAGEPARATRPDIVEERVRFPSGDLSLEGVLAYPWSVRPRRAVLLCPPHPHFAGDMDNNVLRALGARLAADSVTLRFNYRGVGASTIRLPSDLSVFDWWTEVEEKQSYQEPCADVAAAARELVALTGELPMVLVGYSFGAIVGLLHGVERGGIRALVGVGAPFRRFDFGFLSGCPVPCLLLSGDRDFVYSDEEARRIQSIAPACVRVDQVPGEDHFFRENEDMVCRSVRIFLDDATEVEDGGKSTHAT